MIWKVNMGILPCRFLYCLTHTKNIFIITYVIFLTKRKGVTTLLIAVHRDFRNSSGNVLIAKSQVLISVSNY